MGGENARGQLVYGSGLAGLFIISRRNGIIEVLPELSGINAAALNLLQGKLFRMDVMNREQGGDAETAGCGRNQTGHPVVAVDQVRADARNDVVQHFALKSEGNTRIFPAVAGVDCIPVVEDAVLGEVNAFLRQPLPHGLQFLAEDFINIGMEHLPVIWQGDMDIRPQIKQGGYQ